MACRKTIEPPTDKQMKDDPTLGDKFRRDQRGIIVKRFDELPVADLEIILPDKTIGLKLIDNLTLYGTAIGALVGGVFAFFGANLDLNFVLSTLGVVSGKLFQVSVAPPPLRCHVLQMSLAVQALCACSWAPRRRA
jgi:hypothetical protein